ncbi:MAG: autotransporter domain-containing protein [Desulfobacterales bacterium]
MKSYLKYNRTCAIIVTSILFCYTFSFAQTEIIKDAVVDAKDNEIISKLHALEIGPEISFIEYREPGVMKEEGMMIGIGASYTYHNGAMIKIAGRYSYGQVDYQNSGTTNNIDDIIFEIRMLGGHDFKISNSFTITPFLGLGYRYLEDDAAGRISSTGHYGYLRESKYYYSPIGIEAVNVLDNGWSAGAIIEYDYFWKGKQKSYLSDIDSGYNDISNDQNDGYGIRGSINIRKQTDRVFFVIEPFIRYWNIDNSDFQNWTYYGIVIGTGWEPKNESTEIGVKFMIGF